MGSNGAGTSPHSACRKTEPHTHFCCKAASSEPGLGSEDPASHTQPQNSSSALLLVQLPLLSPAQVYNDISTGGVFEEGGLDRSHIFLTIHDAVLFALASIREVVHPPILEEVNLLPSLPSAHRVLLFGFQTVPAQSRDNKLLITAPNKAFSLSQVVKV